MWQADCCRHTNSDRSTKALSSTYARTCRICNKKGLHARAAAKFVQTAGSFDATIKVSKDGLTVGGTSILGLMMLAASLHTDVMLEACGDQAHDALDALADLIHRRFDEE